MAWRDDLRPASFRGVPFFVETLDDEPGRRVEVVRFPGRADVVGQEMGEEAAEGTIAAYLIGDDYIDERDALEAALLEPGPGTLIHPTRGERLVLVHGKLKVQESPLKRGGTATISFSYTVATPTTQFASVNGADALKSIADEGISAASDAFVADFSTAGLSAGTIASQVTFAQDIATAIGEATNTIASIVADVSAVVEIANDIESDTEALLATPAVFAEMLGEAFARLFQDAADLITAPARIGSKSFDASTIGLRKKIVRTVERSVDQILATYRDVAIDTSTPNLEAETANLRALDSVYRATAIMTFCRTAPDMPWTSYQEASASRDRVFAWIEDVEGTVPDDVYESLQDLRVAMARWLDSVASSLPTIRTYSPPDETCAILIAYQLYGDATRESEIVGRNDLANPASVDSAMSIEVASA